LTPSFYQNLIHRKRKQIWFDVPRTNFCVLLSIRIVCVIVVMLECCLFKKIVFLAKFPLLCGGLHEFALDSIVVVQEFDSLGIITMWFVVYFAYLVWSWSMSGISKCKISTLARQWPISYYVHLRSQWIKFLNFHTVHSKLNPPHSNRNLTRIKHMQGSTRFSWTRQYIVHSTHQHNHNNTHNKNILV